MSLKVIDEHLGIRKWLRTDDILEDRPGALLSGDRAIEWAWIVSHLPQPVADILDIGANYSPLSTIAAALGHRVVAIDLSQQPFVFAGVKIITGDLLTVNFKGNKFDCVILCSTIEHFGLVGRYSSPDVLNGDLLGMSRVKEVLKPTGIVLLTIPVGIDACIKPWHHIYGKIRLPKILKGFQIIEESYYAKCDQKVWRQVNKETALSFEGSAALYALGLFVLSI